MPQSRVDGDLRVFGDFSADTMSLPSASVKDTQVASDAAVDADKLEHAFPIGCDFTIGSTGTPTDQQFVVYVCRKSTGATIRQFIGTLNDTGTTTNVQYDLKKNGTTVLSAAVTVTSTMADRNIVTGTISASALAQDDVLTMVLTTTASTGAQGPFCQAWIDEQTP